MKKIYYKGNQPVTITNNAFEVEPGKTILNIEALTPDELLKKTGLYTYQPTVSQQKNGKPAKPGKLVFDAKKGTCTHELIELSDEEIAQQQEDALRAEYEAEQQVKRDEEFEKWKAEKKGKKQ